MNRRIDEIKELIKQRGVEYYLQEENGFFAIGYGDMVDVIGMLDNKEPVGDLRNMQHGDILIRPADNGWVVLTRFDGETLRHVYQADPSSLGVSRAFYHLIQLHFAAQLQSKYRGGVSLNVEERGTDKENINNE